MNASRRAKRLSFACSVFAVGLSLGCGASPQLSPPPKAPAEADLSYDETVPVGRLPADVRPTHYDLSLSIDPRKERFSGAVTIRAELTKPRANLWMHAKDLTISEANLTLSDGRVLSAKAREAGQDGVLDVRFTETVPAGAVTLTFVYDAPFGPLQGLYRVQTENEWYAFTQLEAVHGRTVFPSFDEPAFKTPFDITLEVPPEHKVIGNTPIEERKTQSNGLDHIRFARTEPLPTYLIAFATGPLDIVEAPPIAPNSVRHTPLPFRGVAAKGRGPALAYALAETPGLVKVLEEYFAVPYPYAKLDIIAVPEKGGAMENAGAITFREWLLLFDKENTSVKQQRAFAYVMAHELAHQWFGNLVTMPWWDDIWLNEAFATWMGYHAVDRWDARQQAPVSMQQRVEMAMRVDGLGSARQIRNDVNNVDDIHNAFDAITYLKGGGVLTMFERWVGPDNFRRGVQQYMQTHRFGSADVNDLLGALSTAAKKDVTKPFQTFLFQSGIPFVRASLACEGNVATLSVSQERYRPLGSEADPDRHWQIPICARYPIAGGKLAETCALLEDKSGQIVLNQTKTCPAWVLPNSSASGYYHWSLPPDQLAALLKDGLPSLSTIERMSVVSSVNAGIQNGTLAAGAGLAALAPLAKDKHPAVATAPMHWIATAIDWFDGTKSADAARRFGQSLYQAKYRELGWTENRADESPETKLMRQEVLAFLVHRCKDETVTAAGAAIGKKVLEGEPPKGLDPEITELALSAVGLTADAKVFQQMSEQLKASNDASRRRELIGGLSHIRDPQLAQDLRMMTLDPSIQVIEMLTPFQTQMVDPASREAALTWFEQHLDEIVARMPPGRAGRLPWIMSSLCRTGDVALVDKLFGDRAKTLTGGPQNFQTTRENVSLCIALRGEQSESLQKFFERPPTP